MPPYAPSGVTGVSAVSYLASASVEWVNARFERALELLTELSQSVPLETSYDDKLLLYSVFKQATEGDNSTPRPGLLDVLGRAKWDAWSKRRGITEMEAKRLYVQIVIKLFRAYMGNEHVMRALHELETFALYPQPAADEYESEDNEDDNDEGENEEEETTESGISDLENGVESPRTPAPRRRLMTSTNVAPSDMLAPPLPGYGPPRTGPDRPLLKKKPLNAVRDSGKKNTDSQQRRGTHAQNDTTLFSSFYSPAAQSPVRRGGSASIGQQTLDLVDAHTDAMSTAEALDRIATSLTNLDKRLLHVETSRTGKTSPPRPPVPSNVPRNMARLLSAYLGTQITSWSDLRAACVSGYTYRFLALALLKSFYKALRHFTLSLAVVFFVIRWRAAHGAAWAVDAAALLSRVITGN